MSFSAAGLGDVKKRRREGAKEGGGEEVEVRGERSLLLRESIRNTGNWA